MESKRMKKTLISALFVAGAAMVAQGAFAADGTITFTGNISAQSCTINGNGSGSKDFTVALPTVSASTLAAAGATAGRTPFNIALSDCTPASGNVHTYFEPGPTVDSATGMLVLNAGGASNVEIGLQNSDFSNIVVGAADASQNSKSVAISESGAATLNYYAQYVATGVASAGAANSSVMYTLSYQ
jgi:major type 1 subunit fimbrin (pilin)